MGLTAKQKRFCEEYVVDRNTYAAMTRAGYSENYAKAQGYKMLENVGIIKYIETLQSEQIERLEISSDELTSFFRTVMNDEEAKESDRIKAAENLAKRIGYYEQDNQQRQAVVAPQIILK